MGDPKNDSQARDIVHITGSQALQRLEPFLERAREYAKLSKAENTRRAYAWDFGRYEAWCRENDLLEVAGFPDTLAGYLSSMADEGFAATTVLRAASGISWYLRAKDPAIWPPKVWPPEVRSALEGIVRSQAGRPTNARAAASLALVVQTMPHLGEGLLGLRNRAMVSSGWWFALRRSELVRLEVGDVTFSREGMTAYIRYSKTDQRGEGDYLGAEHCDNDDVCAPCTMIRWLRAAHLTSGPIFRPVTPSGRILERAIAAENVRKLVMDAITAAGYDGSKFGAHSLRAGFITTAIRNGKSMPSTMRQSRHVSSKQFLKYYRPETVFDDNATRGLR